MKNVMLISDNKAVRISGAAALIQAVGEARVPLFTDDGHRKHNGTGLGRYAQAQEAV